MDKKHKGAALPTVIIIMLVVTILGTIIINIALADTKFAMRQQYAVQTHYIARSGIYVGANYLKEELQLNTTRTLENVVSDLNTKITNRQTSYPEEFIIQGKGSYNIKYEIYSSSEVKIISTGTSSENNSVNETVSLRVRIKLPGTQELNPAGWVTGINLQKGVSVASKNYLGKAVSFEGNPIQSPKGGHENSVFQASILHFTDYNGLSFRQIPNSIEITFDASIIYFTSDIQFNTTTSEDKVILTYSDAVAADKKNLSSIMYVSDVTVNTTSGYESEAYYDALISTLGVGTVSRYSSYSFTAGKKYGVLYVGGDILPYGTFVNPTLNSKHYFFFPDGVDLTTDAGRGSLIPLVNDDPLITVINNRFKMNFGSDSYLWGRE